MIRKAQYIEQMNTFLSRNEIFSSIGIDVIEAVTSVDRNDIVVFDIAVDISCADGDIDMEDIISELIDSSEMTEHVNDWMDVSIEHYDRGKILIRIEGEYASSRCDKETRSFGDGRNCHHLHYSIFSC